MKKTLLLFALIVGVATITSAQTVFVGNCLPTTPDNTNTGMVLGNLGNARAAGPFCWSGFNAYDNGVPMPVAGTLKHLFVSGKYTDGGTSPATWNVQVQVFVNGTATALTCTAVLSGGTATPSTVNCSDVTDLVTVALGDIVSVQMSTAGLTCTLSSCPGLALNVSFKKV